MRLVVQCLAVVNQGVDKVLVKAIDQIAVAEETSILNLAQARGVMEVGESYEIIINKITAMSP